MAHWCYVRTGATRARQRVLRSQHVSAGDPVRRTTQTDSKHTSSTKCVNTDHRVETTEQSHLNAILSRDPAT